MNNYILKTSRLTLVPMKMEYLYSTHEYAADFENTKYMINLPNESLEETKEFIMYAQEEWSKEKPEFFEYAILMDANHVGAISLYPEKDDASVAEMGWTVNKKYWNKGICTEAAKALVKFAYEMIGIKRFIAHCDSDNRASFTVMEKIGMIKIDEYGGRYNKQSSEERNECLYEFVIDRLNVNDI